jgi:hypothetical protein
VRTLLTTLALVTVVGTSAGASMGVDGRRVEALLSSIFRDVGSILSSFAGGPDDPKNPVTNSVTLQRDAQRLDAATQKANALADELQKLQRDASDHGH